MKQKEGKCGGTRPREVERVAVGEFVRVFALFARLVHVQRQSTSVPCQDEVLWTNALPLKCKTAEKRKA